jgi:hypothetical protein
MQIAYLLGIPRSGTTLLSALLNQHSQIYCPPEPWTMLATSTLGSVPAAHAADSQLIHDAVAGQLVDPTVHRDIAQRMYSTLLAGRSADWLVDKTPRYHHCLDYIAQTMPEAKYLWIVRNPLDVAASYLSTWNNDVVAALRDGVDHAIYFDFALGFRRLAQFAHHHNVHLVRYEELVRAPAAVMSEVFFHLGVAPIELQQDIASGLKPLLASTFGDVKIAQTSAVHANSVDRYSETLGEDNARLLCALLGRELMNALGYAQYFDRHDASSVEGAASLPEQVYQQGLRLEKRRQSLAGRPYHYWQRQRQLAADYRVSLRQARHAPTVDLAAEMVRLRDLVVSQSHQLASALANQDHARSDSQVQNAEAVGHLAEQVTRLERKLADLSTAMDQQRASVQSLFDNEFVALRQSMTGQVRELVEMSAQMEAGLAKGNEQLSQLERKIASIQQSRLSRLFGWGSK